MSCAHFGNDFMHQVHRLQISDSLRWKRYSFEIDFDDLPELIECHHMERSSQICPRIIHKYINLPQRLLNPTQSQSLSSPLGIGVDRERDTFLTPDQQL